MRRKKRRPMYYYASCLHDGTIVATYPIRKPTPKRIKQEKLKIDKDGVCDNGWYSTGKEFSDVNMENRFRFQDIIATRLNTRRAIREMVFPHLLKLQKDMNDIHNKLDHIQQLLECQLNVA